jgi:gas vesicle protein
MNGTPKSSTSWDAILSGLLLGSAIGAVTALLYAPKKGVDTQAEIKARLDDLKTRIDAAATTLAAQAKERLSDCCTDLQQAVTAGVAAGRERMAEEQHQAGLE